MSHIADKLGFECYETYEGIWVKERPDGRRGPCVADEAVLWQALQAATGGKPQLTADMAELVRENERLHTEVEVWSQEYAADVEVLKREVEALRVENEELRANQRRKPGRKPRSRSDAGSAGGPEALAAPEQDPLDEEL